MDVGRDLGGRVEFQYLLHVAPNLGRVRVAGGVRQADGGQPRLQIGRDDGQHAGLVDGPFEAAAEGALHAHLHLAAGILAFQGDGDDAAGGVLGAHARVLAAVGVGSRDAHADELDAHLQGPFQSLFIQHQAGQHRAVGFLCEDAEQVVRVRHLGHLVAPDEGTHLDDVHARGRHAADPVELDLCRHHG